MARLLLLNGPNLNLLGTREPERYGSATLGQIEQRATELAAQLGHTLLCFQTNAEHELLERIQRSREDQIAFMILNPGALTHTSVALRDALLAVKVPFIEVHLTNTAAREPFRHHSFIADIAAGRIVGLGAIGYDLAVRAAAAQLQATG
ncbi:MAG TPA: type II 3-dehydroquinate dehydratase [Steroidobacteraceae bacterium]|nr:type II 3-dehydroquinate dehydratase [Steroidobacteraceae bacterium]